MNLKDKHFNILELFATPVYTTSLPSEYSNLIPILDQEEMFTKKDTGDIDYINFGFRSKNSYILHTEKYKTLSEYILSLVKNFGEMMGYQYNGYKFTQSWISFKHPNQHHSIHSHPNSIISGVFYYGHYENDTPVIEFHKSKIGVNTQLLSPNHQPNPDYPFSYEKTTISPSPGLLILFPSFLNHSVPLNTTNRVRKSLAFNCIPSIGFGLEEDLTELKL